ncbi:MAG: 2-dehydropantoate 2-reductase [Candidatus Bathyarchaeia archaeon]|jgi:2-dehydropantoate 2-reductase
MLPSGKLSFVVVGAGAIGLSVTGWVAPKHDGLFLLARGESAKVIRNKGLKFYVKGQEASAAPVAVKTIESLSEVSAPAIVVIAVKNYDLEATAAMLREQLGSHQPIIVALQNGVENQKILPKYFEKIVYGVVCFNAWRDAPGMVGHQKQGYIILGTPKNDLQTEQRQVADILRLGLECSPTDRLEDAVHCKLAVNLTNALTALVCSKCRPTGSLGALDHMTARLIWEGIQVVKANGFKEHELGTIPSWKTFRTSAALPAFVTGILYRFVVREELGLNSTAQDLASGKTTTELESLNGYMLSLAQKAGIPMPINRAVYELAKERFGPDFQPMPEAELLESIRKRIKK